MDNTNDIIEEFKREKPKLDSFNIELLSLTRELLQSESVNFHQITGRVKEENSLEQKIVRKNGKYSSLFEITDVIRIITY